MHTTGTRAPHDPVSPIQILNMWTFIVKFWSCALSVAAGLPVGPEGPIIHMGAFLGSAISGLHSTTLRFDLGVFRHLRNSKHKRDFVTAGVAAGVAAAFDAPLGGLLFAFEEVASFWHSHLGWQVFFCCVVAVLTQVCTICPATPPTCTMRRRRDVTPAHTRQVCPVPPGGRVAFRTARQQDSTAPTPLLLEDLHDDPCHGRRSCQRPPPAPLQQQR